MKLEIEFVNLSQLMDVLMMEIPQMYVDLHMNKKEGGENIKWQIK